MSGPAAAELPVYRAKIEPDWIDYNGHLRDAYYLLAASYAIDGLMDYLGLDAAYRASTHCTLYSLEMHVHFLNEIKSSDDLKVITSILDFDRKRIHAGCTFVCSRLSHKAAMVDMMLMHVHQGATPAGASFPETVTAKLSALKLSAAAREAFGPVSRKIELKHR
ncbi:MAG TPA: thioesterase family protein [Steroidobacteraceae bacterium]|nr:thioesterase family protein [Steroidobacteraceae bacterium]